MEAGNDVKVTWDGKTDDGFYAAPGDYRVEVQAEDSAGNKSLIMSGVLRLFY